MPAFSSSLNWRCADWASDSWSVDSITCKIIKHSSRGHRYHSADWRKRPLWSSSTHWRQVGRQCSLVRQSRAPQPHQNQHTDCSTLITCSDRLVKNWLNFCSYLSPQMNQFEMEVLTPQPLQWAVPVLVRSSVEAAVLLGPKRQLTQQLASRSRGPCDCIPM